MAPMKRLIQIRRTYPNVAFLNKYRSRRLSQALTNQNFTLIWLDSNIDGSNTSFKDSLTYFEQVVGTINTFTDADKCVDFLNELKDEKAFMIVSNALGQSTVPRIHHMSQLDSLYVLQQNKSEHTQWTQEWAKVKGIFTSIDAIYDIVKQDVERWERDFISISVTSADLTGLDSSFMYTQLLKETLLEMEYKDKEKRELAEHCRILYSTDTKQLQIINEFEQDYDKHTPIWWYSRECFTYQMLNKALRTQEAGNIIKMGFFLRDVHRHIEKLHLSQNQDRKLFTVYRGQGMTSIAYEKIRTNKGGLLSFNNFLSTSLNEQKSLEFAEMARKNPEMVGILFEMTIDPSITSVPFAAVKEVSAFPQEEEILFSMHTIFRVREIKLIEDRLWRVDLVLTSDDDEELKLLTDHMRKETQGESGWHRIGKMLHRLGELNKAEKVYKLELESVSEDNGKDFSFLCNELGRVKDDKGDYEGALEFYKKSLEIRQKYLAPNHPDLATTYHNIANAYDQLGDYSKALEFYEKSLEIDRQSYPSDHQNFAPTYNNMGEAYKSLGEYPKAFEFYNKSLEIYQKFRPSNHPDLAQIYTNIGSTYNLSGEYSKALECYKKSLQISQKSLPPQHPDVVNIFNSIGSTYTNMAEYSKALEFYQNALTICEKSDFSNLPYLASTYGNIGVVHDNMGEYSKALEFHQKSLEISQQTLSSDHPNFAAIYSNIASIHNHMGEYSKAFEFYQKSLEIDLQFLPANHPYLAGTYGHVGQVHDKIGNYSKALELHQKSLEIRQESLPPNHPSLAKTYYNMGEVHIHTGEFSKALEFHNKSLEIRQKSLPSNHPDLAQSYNSIGQIHDHMEEYSEALELHQKSLRIRQSLLPPNHPDIAETFNSIGELHDHMGEYSKALEFHNKSLKIRQKSLPPNHPDLARTYNNIGRVYDHMGQHAEAHPSYERAVKIGQDSLPENHPALELYRHNLTAVKKNL